MPGGLLLNFDANWYRYLFDAISYDDIWETVWSDEDKIAYASTPMFLVHAVKQ